MKSFVIVIVNWNSGIQLKNCINSIERATKVNCILNKIIVVDNASTDDSINLINKKQNNLEIIQNNINLGFGRACNQGAKNSNSDYILFLNPDMLIFKNTFLNLFSYIKNNDKDNVAIYGIQLLDKDNNIQKSCARFPNVWNMINRSMGLNKLNNKIFKTYAMDNWNHKDTKIVDHVMGAFYLIKTSVFFKVNGFDKSYFVYIEDLDLSKKISDLGYKSLYISESKAYHKGGGTSEQIKAKRLFYSTRSRIIYGFKHFGLLKGLFLFLFTLSIEPITRTLFLLFKGKYSEVIENFKGFGMLYMDSKNIIKLGLKK